MYQILIIIIQSIFLKNSKNSHKRLNRRAVSNVLAAPPPPSTYKNSWRLQCVIVTPIKELSSVVIQSDCIYVYIYIVCVCL
jgi:hypothetical protein